MIELIVATGMLLWYAFAVWAVKHEEELRDNYRLAKSKAEEITNRWFPEEKRKEEGEVKKTETTYLEYVSSGCKCWATGFALLDEIWTELKEWVGEKKFDPQSEADIQSFLYHGFIKRLGTAKGLVCAPHPHKNKQTDLNFKNKLFIETKFILRSGIRNPTRWKLRTKIVEADIQKLAEIKKTYPNAAVALAIFAANYSKKYDEEWYDPIKGVCDRSGVLMFRAWKEML